MCRDTPPSDRCRNFHLGPSTLGGDVHNYRSFWLKHFPKPDSCRNWLVLATFRVVCRFVLQDMAPKSVVGEGLGLGFKPTQSEIEAAKSILAAADSKAGKSKMNSMTAWLNKHKDVAGHSEALEARGEERQEYLVKYLVWMKRRGQATTVSSKEAKHEEAKKLQHRWMSEFEITKEKGEAKCKLWVESKKLTWRPDPVTQCDKKEHIEWKIPVDWLEVTDTNTDATKIGAEAAAKDVDFENLGSLDLAELKDLNGARVVT